MAERFVAADASPLICRLVCHSRRGPSPHLSDTTVNERSVTEQSPQVGLESGDRIEILRSACVLVR